MIIYLLKFSACLFIFLAFYKLVMERESMHQIKRYFLLAALVLSLCIPLITFIQYVEPVVLTNMFVVSTDQILTDELLVETPPVINYLPILLWSLYGLGVVYFGIKFVWNLSQIVLKIKRHPKQKNKSYIHVLLNDLIVPHTFFNYIFLNKHKFETNTIPKEVFWHEEAHAKQKHSLDVIFIELIQVIFWFNPLIYFTKSAIKMNHEFLADEAVLKHGIEPSIYQQLLLAFSSNALEPVLANAINYSSIKKRFTVMKTHTSKQKIWLRSFFLLPLVALTLYGFSGRKEVVKETFPNTMENQEIKNQQKATPEEIAEYNKLAKHCNSQLESEHPIIKTKDISRIAELYVKMSIEQKKNAEPYPDFPPPPPPPAPETGFIEVNGETLFYVKFIPIEYYNKKGYKVDENGKTLNGNKQVNASDVLPGQYITKVYQNDKVVVEFKDNGAENIPPPPPPRETPKLMKGNDIPPPPPPPAPISPLEHIKEMAKKGAMFYYDGKAISSNDAINLVKKNGELNISTTQSNSNPIKVTITEKPILIDTQTKNDDKIMMNGKILNDNFIQLSKDELMKTKFSTVRGDVSIFQLKIPGQKTQSIKGNTLNAESKNNLEKAQIGDHILIFGIKDSQGKALSPITIEIKK